jgi:eukaryotic-like serine/threonine-protein kinase
VNHPRSDETLIARLFDLPARERAAFWQRACADDQALPTRHPEFARLFSCPEISSNAASIPPTTAPAPVVTSDAIASVLESALRAADREAVGVRVGHYKLLQKIGEGGFGAVWMAEQLEPIRRRVALKIVKVGMDTDEVIARFEAERQALALMDHPNIARVFDAGATTAGRPYFVMELVRGVAITSYCDDNRLTAEARLRLFISVCQAVQHAHQKGVIHRDLKPSNILVTLHDGIPVPKVIDFGIAKAMDKQLTDKTLVTLFHAFVGTPAYTSPEQMEMSGLDVDTRSDIYSLGVLLYELLAGRPPFDPDALVKSGLEAMRRTIRETDPPRPSHRLGTLTDADRTSVAHARNTDAAKLSLLLRGDVDWIVMHCLEKDRTRRYETANGLARDIERHLAHEPVSARPPSTWYRTQKFIRRHKLGVSATAAVAVSLVAGLIVSSTLFVSERAARTRAVAAEKSEEKLRQQADTARVAEAHRASRTSLALAEQFFTEPGRAHEGLAHLVRAARSDSANTDLGPRLVSALAYRNFPEPVGEPLRHPTQLWRAYYTKDGRHCVTIAQDSVIRYWDLGRAALLQTITPGATIQANVNLIAVDLSPDGRSVAAGDGDGNANVWNLESGRKILGPLSHQQRISSVQFSPAGDLLAVACDDRTARIWDTATGEVRTVLQHEYRVRRVTFSPDGRRAVTTTWQGPWRIWRVPSGEPVTPSIWCGPPGGSDNALSTPFSPDGALVAVADNSGVQLFDSISGTTVGSRMAHSGPCYGTAFTRDGKKLVTTSDDSTARVWQVPSGKPLLSLKHGVRVHLPRLSTDSSQVITRADDGLARVWDLTTGLLATEPIRETDARSVEMSPNGSELMTTASDGTVRRHRIIRGAALPLQLPLDAARLGVARTHDTTPTAWVFHPDRMQKIDLLTGKSIGEPRSFPIRISAFTSSLSSNRAAVQRAGENHWELWDLRGTDVVRQHLGEFTARFRAFSANASRFAIYDDSESLRVWDTKTASLVAGPLRKTSRYYAFSPDDSQLAFAMIDNSVVIWDLAKNQPIGEPMRHQSAVQGVRFSPDGLFIATGSQDGLVRIWNAKTTQPAGAPVTHRGLVRGLAFAQDGRRLLTFTASESQLWDISTRAPLGEPLIGGNDIYSAGFIADDARIVTWARANRDVRFWSVGSGQLLTEPLVVAGSVGTDVIKSDLSGSFLSMTARRGLIAWSVPVQTDRQPLPAWLLRLATAVAGGEIDHRAVFRERPFDRKDFDAIRRELAALPDDAPYVEWGRWVLADRATRPIAPGFKITATEAATLATTVSQINEER